MAGVGWREAARRRLDGEDFDLLVAGGGATGAAIARDAATRGLRVALCERGDFASQTSSRSSRLIHGGLRYLQHGDFHLVFESLTERRRLLKTGPHLCRPRDFLYPSYAGRFPSPGLLALGVGLYDALALWRPPVRSRHFKSREVFATAPWLRGAGLLGAQQYVDCQTDDARLVLENVLDAASAGAVVISQVEILPPRKASQRRAGGFRVVQALDHDCCDRLEIRARLVVNATGPFCDGFALGPPRLRPSLGVHLVLEGDRLLTMGRAAVIHSPRDGRLMFVLPAGTHTIVGTTETDWPGDGDPARPPRLDDEIRARRSDVDYLLEAVNHAFPPAAVHPSDVVSTFAGLRPLIARGPASPGATSREHAIWSDASGCLNVAGGKLTTMRSMAEQAVDCAVEILRDRGLEGALRPCQTRARPLPGAGPPLRHAAGNLAPDIEAHLRASYGSRLGQVLALIAGDVSLARRLHPDLPYVAAELEFAVRSDLACEVDDVLWRRVPLALVSRTQGLDVAEEAASLLARERNWSEQRRARSLSQFRDAINASRAWQAD